MNFLIGVLGVFMTSACTAELILLASPSSADPYYDKARDDIVNFQINYARKIIENGDNVLVLSTKALCRKYVKALGNNSVAIAPMLDIWMRDFTLTNPENPIMFRYTAAGQGSGQKGQNQADQVQYIFFQLIEKAGLSFKKLDLLNDGGNYVDDYAGNVVISHKFLQDNHISQAQGREKLSALTAAKNVAFIEADEQGGLEHADGVVSFVGTNKLMINSYPKNLKYSDQLKKDLKRQLPGVKIYEITTPYNDSQIYDKRFGSACGLYTNMLVTKERIYLPQFGIPQDKLALKQVQAVTSLKVVPVLSSEVCYMGGGVRCMSLQIRGENARKLLKYAENYRCS